MITLNRAELRDKIHACWIGKNIGGTMGTPYEGRREINDIQGFVTKPGEVLPNDDLDLQMIWLRVIEEDGPYKANADLLGEYWIDSIPPHWNEYGICKGNMRGGLVPPLSGQYHNDWKDSNGAWIRTEIWAGMAPASPDTAIRYAREDACVDHGGGEGTYAAIFVAAVESAAFVLTDIRALIDIGLSKIPEKCRVAQSIRLLLDCYDNGVDWKTCRNRLVEDSADLGWFEAPCNVAFAMLGMLYGEGDFKRSMILAINCGDDTDCTGATLGALWGIMYGTAGIPEDWASYIGDSITTVAINRPSVYKIPATCSELTDRVMAQQAVMLHANHVNNVKISDAPTHVDEGDIKGFYGGNVAKQLCEKKGNAYIVDFYWASAEVIFDGEPEIAPNGEVGVTIHFRNKFRQPQHMHFRWLLPEGFTVKEGRSALYLSHETPHSKGEAEMHVTIVAGDTVDAMNRPVLEVTAMGRPHAGYVPITLLG